jgi:hypothetical protein
VIGSASFWHEDSEATCVKIGELLAGLPNLLLLTGGVPGVGEAVGSSFFRTRRDAGLEPHVYHILPKGYPRWDYGDTLFAGSDMNERREVLGRLSKLYLAVEGGPGTEHEARVALLHGSIVIPIGRSGGFSWELHKRGVPSPRIDTESWVIMGAEGSTPQDTANAALHAVKSSLELSKWPTDVL